MNRPLQQLLARPDIWKASQAAVSDNRLHALPTGHAGLDAALHQGGWPQAGTTEILGDGAGIGEMQLLLPALSHCSQTLPLFMISPPHQPYAPTLQAQGIRLDKLLILLPPGHREVLWSIEQVLRSGIRSCLMAWIGKDIPVSYRELRRLQLGAQANGGMLFLFRPLQAACASSPASLRLSLHVKPLELELEILKQRGGWGGQRLSLPRSRELLQQRIIPAMLPTHVSPAHRIFPTQQGQQHQCSELPDLPRPSQGAAAALH